MRRLILIAVISMTGFSCAIHQKIDDSSTEKATEIAEFSNKIALKALQADWAKFDTNTHVRETVMGQTPSGSPSTFEWYPEITPPFPTEWPSSNVKSASYYAYAAYWVTQIHGPFKVDSEPWAKVILQDGAPPDIELLSKAIGKTMAGHGSHPISWAYVKRRKQILEDGEKSIPTMLSWTRLPQDADKSVKAIRDYYCLWESNNKTLALKFIKDNHKEFFAWLSCPSIWREE